MPPDPHTNSRLRPSFSAPHLEIRSAVPAYTVITRFFSTCVHVSTNLIFCLVENFTWRSKGTYDILEKKRIKYNGPFFFKKKKSISIIKSRQIIQSPPVLKKIVTSVLCNGTCGEHLFSVVI